jgi:orotate phosphoribosyltransferase
MTNETNTDISAKARYLWRGISFCPQGGIQTLHTVREAVSQRELCGTDLPGVPSVRGEAIDVVSGPPWAAVQLAFESRRQLGCENFFAERDNEGKMALRRGFTVTTGGGSGAACGGLITTGGSVREVAELVRGAAEYRRLCCVVDRSGVKLISARR